MTVRDGCLLLSCFPLLKHHEANAAAGMSVVAGGVYPEERKSAEECRYTRQSGACAVAS